MNYKGKNINTLLSGFYEVYSEQEQRFLKFDTLQGAKNYIKYGRTN
jgi:hypothetical protein